MDAVNALGPGPTPHELPAAVFTFLIANSASIPFNHALGTASGETIGIQTTQIATSSGILGHALAAIVWKQANLAGDNPAVNSIGFGIPTLAIPMLVIAPALLRHLRFQNIPSVSIARWDLIITGASAVIISNLMINIRGRQHPSPHLLADHRTTGH